MAGSATAEAEEGALRSILNPKLIYLKLVYFTYISALIVVRPYLALFMTELGLSEFQVGLLRCLEPVAIIVFSPMWGSTADKCQNRKFLLGLCAFGSALFLPALLLVPPVGAQFGEEPSVFDDHGGEENSSDIPFSERSGHLSVNSTGVGSMRMDEEYHVSLFPRISLFTFALTALVSFADNVFIAGFLPLFDAQTMALVKRYPGSSFGGQRWSGALAVVVFSPVIGLLTDWYGGTVTRGEVYFLQSSYVPSFILFAVLILISMFPTMKTEDVATDPPPSFSRELLGVFREIHVLLTYVVFVVAGACKGIVATFLFIFLDELGASKFLMSISLVATCVIEVPCLLISNRLIRVLGYEVVICVGLLAYAVRMYAYSVLVDPWGVIPIELLHGVCYGILWPACTEYTNHITPEGMSTTLQSLTHAAKAGVGQTIGVSVGGLIYNLYGARMLYQGSTAVTVAVTCIYTLDSLYVHWCEAAVGDRESDIEKGPGESKPLFEREQG